MVAQFSPHDFTAFKWEGTASFFHYVTVVLLLAVFLAAELTPFYLKVIDTDNTLYSSAEADDLITQFTELVMDGA